MGVKDRRPSSNLCSSAAGAHTLPARTICQDNERSLSGQLRRKLQAFLYRAEDYSVSMLPSTDPGGVQA